MYTVCVVLHWFAYIILLSQCMNLFMLISQGILIILIGPYQTPAKTTTNIQKTTTKTTKTKLCKQCLGFIMYYTVCQINVSCKRLPSNSVSCLGRIVVIHISSSGNAGWPYEIREVLQCYNICIVIGRMKRGDKWQPQCFHIHIPSKYAPQTLVLNACRCWNMSTKIARI